MTFKFDMKQKVAIVASGETGEVIGRAEYVASENTYLVRYKAADGCATEDWWNEDALADHGMLRATATPPEAA